MSKVLTVEVAEKFIKNPKSITINEYSSITDSAADVLSNHKDTLYLNGLISISEDAAEFLSKHNGGYIYLNGLTSISCNVANAIAKYQGWVSLNGLTSISEDIADELAKHENNLYLNGLTSISDTVAEKLAKHRGNLDISGLTVISENVAISLAKHRKWLTLNGLTSMPDSVAEPLSKHSSGLYLDGLISLSDFAAQVLSQQKGWISLKKLDLISDIAADALAKHRSISLNNKLSEIIDRIKQKKNEDDSNIVLKKSYAEKSKDTRILKVLSDSKQIIWEDDEDWQLSKYQTQVSIDGHEYFIYAVVSTSGSEIWLKDSLTNKEISSGELFEDIESIWHSDSSTFEGDSKKGEVYLYDGVELKTIIYYDENNNILKLWVSDFYKWGENDVINLATLDLNILDYVKEYISYDKIYFIDLDFWQLHYIPDILFTLIPKLRGTLKLILLQTLTNDEALLLSKHRGELILSGLTSIEDGVADRLSKHFGTLDLSALEEISDISAKYLSKYQGILSLENLQTISETAISSLLETKGIIICQGQLYNEYRKKYADSIRSEKMFFDENNLSISCFSIVPQLGISLDFIKNIDNIIYVVFDRKSKISITDFLQAFGFSILDILNLFSVSFVQIRNNREDLEKGLGQKFATKVYRRWIEDFVDEDTEEVFSLERSEEIFNINDKLTEDSIHTLIELPIEYIYLQSDTSINFDLYLNSYAIGRASSILEAQQLFYKSILMKDVGDNETANEFVKSYSDGQAINLGPNARKKLNDILNITTPRTDGLYLEDYIQIIKYLISN